MAKMVTEKLNAMGVDAEYCKFERAENPSVHMRDIIHSFEQNPTKVFVVDRFHLTEYVMRLADKTVTPSLLKRSTGVVDRAIGAAGGSVVVLTASRNTLKRRIETRQDGRGLEMESFYLSESLWNNACKNFWVDYVFKNDDNMFDKILGFLVNVCLRGVEK
jgi:hypothetical protein